MIKGTVTVPGRDGEELCCRACPYLEGDSICNMTSQVVTPFGLNISTFEASPCMPWLRNEIERLKNDRNEFERLKNDRPIEVTPENFREILRIGSREGHLIRRFAAHALRYRRKSRRDK